MVRLIFNLYMWSNGQILLHLGGFLFDCYAFKQSEDIKNPVQCARNIIDKKLSKNSYSNLPQAVVVQHPIAAAGTLYGNMKLQVISPY